MKLVVGLGNPGRQYAQTRHNIGFMVAAKLVELIGGSSPRSRFDGEISEGTVDGEKMVVLCPSTFMNASGKSVRKAVDFYKIAPTDVLVVCDDMNLPIGRLRIRAKGSAGGQKGLADIIRHLQSEEIPRLRIGIDPPPPGWAVPDYVLSAFKRSEQAEVDAATERAAHAAVDWTRHDMAFCMNQYNTRDNR